MNTFPYFVFENLLSSLSLTIRRSHTEPVVFRPAKYEEESLTDGMVKITWTFDTLDSMKELTVSALADGRSALFSLNANIGIGATMQGAFTSTKALSLSLGSMEPDALNGSYLDKLWWTIPSFAEKFEDLPTHTQSLLIRKGDRHYHLMLLTGDNFRCEIEKGKMNITSDMAGLYALNGTFLCVTEADDPFTAIEENFAFAHANGGLRVPLRKERTLPDLFKGFGFCTWDCFYGKVTSAGVYQKLDELRNKQIPVKWIILDDGWLSVHNGGLTAFEANSQIPEGMKAFVSKLKTEYGIEKVGVWHAFQGYWHGVDPESPLYEEQRDNLMKTPAGFVLPSSDEEKAFRFWDAFHSFLADCGVDFVKVDNQSSYATMTEGVDSTAELCRIAHKALERSVFKNFGGAIINCMGMDMENALARPLSAVSRNSDDFFPRAPRGFAKHLVQNVYNAMSFSQLYFCDFDMWWSDHESAIQSGVLRAVSGSPIYVSDEVGRSSMETIAPVIEDDGTVMLADEAGRPTLDLIYTDCRATGQFQKVWNKAGKAFALAIFNITEEARTEDVCFGCIPGLKGKYLAYEYFTKETLVIDENTVTSVTLPGDGTAAWSIYPIETLDGEEGAFVGSFDKYLPIASAHKTWKQI